MTDTYVFDIVNSVNALRVARSAEIFDVFYVKRF